MIRKLFALILFLVLLVWSLLSWDSTSPEVYWIDPPEQLGPTSRLQIKIWDQGQGLQALRIRVHQANRSQILLQASYPDANFPWDKGTLERRLEVSLVDLPDLSELVEGKVLFEVWVKDHPSLGIWSRETVNQRSFDLDLTPPRIVLLSEQHYVRQGGSETLTYRVSEKVHSTGVTVGDRKYKGYPILSKGDGVYICLFALGHNQSISTPMTVWAEDFGGNRHQQEFWKKVLPGRFQKKNINISDRFLQSVLPEIVERTSQVQAATDLVEMFLEVNGMLRRLNNRQILEMAGQTSPKPLWTGTFLQLSNSKVESSFADFRSYYHGGQKIDEQTHLGFDLASLPQSPVECANDGVVVHAGYLGIYGNCVIVDHGIGLQSLYGHMSQLEVKTGDPVRRGQSLGRTGKTGLAGGDHLHFTMLVQGTQVNPIEWWDESWVKERVLSRIGIY